MKGIILDAVAIFGENPFREKLLSRNTQDRTVGFRRSKKGKRSTRSRLCVDPGFASFDKLQEVGVSPYLCFIPIFKCFSMFRLV